MVQLSNNNNNNNNNKNMYIYSYIMATAFLDRMCPSIAYKFQSLLRHKSCCFFVVEKISYEK